MRDIILILVWIILSGCELSEFKTIELEPTFTNSVDLESDFISPPDYSKPRVYWWWLEGNISKDGILRDLTEMKKVGIKGAIIFDAGSSSYNGIKKTKAGEVFMSEKWKELFTYSCIIADSLDLEISLNIGSGWNDGGPWVTSEEASKKMVWSEMEVKGPEKLSAQLPMPEGLLYEERENRNYYMPIAVLAMKKTSNSDSIKPLENMDIKAVHSIKIPKKDNATGFDWDIFMKEEASPEGDCNAYLRDVIDISDKVDEKGNINWQVPEGNYIIMRFGYTGTGIKVSTHSPGGGGLAIDYLSKKAMDLQYDNTVGELLKNLRQQEVHSLKYLHDDSWELGAANWTHDFESLFNEINDYSIIQYLPILTGRIIESREISNRFLYDFRRTIADLIWENHYKHFSYRASVDGLGIHSESGGPHPAPIDALKNLGLNAIPMGEFWIRANTHRITPESRLYVKQPASAAHIYGKRFVQAEGPTSIGPHWEEDFAYMKPTLDRMYCEGLNRLVIHTFTHSPEDAGIPGNEYFAGTHFNPNVTWWKHVPDFLTWNSRISFMLSQGLFVGDVCFYYGDNVPNQVPLKHIHEGLGEGYDYDVCNTDVLLNRMTVHDGKIYLPDGMSYEVLVLPERIGITPEVIVKLEKLVKEGATIVGSKPVTSVGLRGDREAISVVNKISDLMWGSGSVSEKNSYGKGTIFTGKSLRTVLQSKGVDPDFVYKSNKQDTYIDYIHRKYEDVEIYYIANRNEKSEFFHASFRVNQKTPELWNPLNGEITSYPIYTCENGRVSMPISLEPFGSTFVVFRKDTVAHFDRITWNNKELFPELPIDTSSIFPVFTQGEDGLLFIKSGDYGLSSSVGKIEKISVEEISEIKMPTSWNVSFDPEWGGPNAIIFDKLDFWNNHDNSGIRYYSGTASYENVFKISLEQCAGKRMFLDLGIVYNMCEVFINSKKVALLWQPPFIVDITEYLVDGVNKLDVRVTNLWPNRLVGDAFLDENERYTKTNVEKFDKEYPLLHSGLKGPVVIKLFDKLNTNKK